MAAFYADAKNSNPFNVVHARPSEWHCHARAQGRIVRYATSTVAFGSPDREDDPFTPMPRPLSSTALSELAIGSGATLASLELPEEIQGLLMHLGFVPESRVLALRRAPAGDPTVYCVDGAEVALRKETAQFISVHSVYVAVRKAGQ
jgi:Fe2+ transport system protein FeoA